ncbi:hypothetical protein N0V83_006094 [Neocucurbitaria cava]|uniref:Uncharacterized protein n=1 Tax=Neocucurbitaria cava TaxID=798079 RepID=A0A9W8Y6P0_9PLEO|nr:hypothetical protein N0V83_006094 [Neocucurbitaria cava]
MGTAKQSQSPTTRSINDVQFNTASFKDLQCDEERQLLDVVDGLRRRGLNDTIELPQLVVCGDQSSGKSSVLEAITEIPFPRNEGLCTRFATEIILRRDHASTIVMKIIPSKDASPQEKKKLEGFQSSIVDFKQLPDVIEDATAIMGLGKAGQPNYKNFSRHVLSMTITGPERPMLTLVDLPGLIHFARENPADKDLVFDLVREYMANPRTIILAVITGKNDLNNQVVLDEYKKVDPHGRRTLGIITKPDTISQREIPSWIELAQNKVTFLEREWHVLRNCAPDEGRTSFRTRNKVEKEFFEQGLWATLPKEHVGVKELRKRLSGLLFCQIKKELPGVHDEIAEKLRATEDEIRKLGEKRETINEQRVLLMGMAIWINGNLKAGVTGHYADKFFRDMDMTAAPDSDKNIRRFRAAIQHLNNDFAKCMRLQGHNYSLGDDYELAAEENMATKERRDVKNRSLGSMLPKPKTLSRKESIDWVRDILIRNRGPEMPGNFSHALILRIFEEQTSPWEVIAREHVNRVARCCKEFAYSVIEATPGAPPEFKERIVTLSVKDTLDVALKAAKEELDRIVTDKNTIMTYDPSFTAEIQKQRQKKHARIAQDAAKEATVPQPIPGATRTGVDLLRFEEAMANTIEKDQDKFSAEGALDYTMTYYIKARSYFIYSVTVYVIERHLVKNLPDTILSLIKVSKMSDKEIHYVAAEPKETTALRNHLEDRRKMLQIGLDMFKVAMGGLKP